MISTEIGTVPFSVLERLVTVASNDVDTLAHADHKVAVEWLLALSLLLSSQVILGTCDRKGRAVEFCLLHEVFSDLPVYKTEKTQD